MIQKRRAIFGIVAVSLTILSFFFTACLGRDARSIARTGSPESAQAPQANVYYVAPPPLGNDANLGTQTAPWATIQHAAETLVAGDTVYIMAGTYNERVVPQNSGNAGSPITYAAYPGETAIIDGTGVVVPEYGGLFDLAERDYIRVSGLQVIHSSYYGIVADTSSHITIEYNYVYDTYSSGISSWSSNNIIVDGNEVVGACTGPWQEHISISSTDTFEVRYNHIHDVMPGTEGKEGLCVKDASAHGKVYGNHVYNLNHVGIYVDAEAEHLFDVEVYQNVVHDIEGMGFSLASEQGGTLENIRLYNNIAYDNLVGLWLSACCIETHPFQDITIINNTLAYNGRDGWGGGIGIENTQVQNVVIRNNICSQNIYSQMAADPSILPELTVDHNLTDGERDPEFEFYGVGDRVDVSPSFVNPLMGNYHLQPDSPAIDAGSDLDAPADDLDGRARPQDGNDDGVALYDIGAFEAPLLDEHLYLPLLLRDFADATLDWWQPTPGVTWQWQLDTPLDPAVDAQVYDIDMFDNDASAVAALHAQGRKVICYISVGSWEEWRPDADQFPPSVLGNDYAGWSGEKWLDIRQIDLLAPIMRARLDQCQAKGFDGVEPDNMDGYTNATGFPLTYQDQLDYNTWLAQEAHTRGLSIGLKNDGDQVGDLLAYFDWALTEDCFAENWCDQVQPFTVAGKAVLAAEYTDQMTGAEFQNQVCPQAATLSFSAILKNRDLDAWREVCH
jgi:hypothetical protein